MKILRILYRSLALILLLYTVVAGLLIDVPDLPVIGQSIRFIFFHVGMWFAMIVLLMIAMISSIRHLKTPTPAKDLQAREAVKIAMFFGVVGLISGMIWAKMAWGAWWVNDPKLNGAAISMLAYAAYLILRSSVKEEHLKGRLAAVYNILAFALMMVFMMVLPRLSQSMHPGQGGNPALNPAELDSRLRIVFYPAMLGWILLGVWIMEIRTRRAISHHQKQSEESQ